MSNTKALYFTKAHELWGNGYRVIPLRPDTKIPFINNFLDFDFGENTKPFPADCGVGVVCGKETGSSPAVYGIDIDIDDEEEAVKIRNLVQKHLGFTIYRIGRFQRCMLLYQGAEGLRKISTEKFDLLAEGQQFVAYGTHPITRSAYTWPGMLGDPTCVKVSDLPVLDIDKLEQLILLTGGRKSSRLTGERDELPSATRLDISLKDAQNVLVYLDPGAAREEWLFIGMGLHHEFKGDTEALTLWDTWSKKSDKYKEGECEYYWSKFSASEKEDNITFRFAIKRSNELRKDSERRKKQVELHTILTDIASATDPDTLLDDIAPRCTKSNLTESGVNQVKKTIVSRYKALTGCPLPEKLLGSKIAAQTNVLNTLTEFGNAQRMVDYYGEDLMYCAETESWFHWRGGRWESVGYEVVMQVASDTVKKIGKEVDGIEDDDVQDEIYKWYIRSQTRKMVDNIIALARKHQKVLVKANEIDADRNYLGVANGAVYLPTGDLIDADRGLRITLNANLAYDPEATAPVFEQTVMEAFYDNKEMAKFLQRLIGYSLIGHPEREEIIVIPEGNGANGKSTIFNAIHAALGDYGKYASADSFTGAHSAKGSGAREDILRLAGSRFVYVTELEESNILKENVVKGMVGGEAMPARALYARSTIEVEPTWVAFMPTNHLPIIKGEDEGIWRKIVVLPFTRNFKKDPVIRNDPYRKDKVKKELKGILNWAIQGALEYKKYGLMIPQSISAATAAYRDDSDLIGDWIEACCSVDENKAAPIQELWGSWEGFATSLGKLRYIPSATALSRRLASRGFKKIRSTMGVKGRGFSGLTLKQSWENEFI